MTSTTGAGARHRRRLKEQSLTPDALDTNVIGPDVYNQDLTFVFPLLVFFRVINALCVKTFFQPDEYFQSLEPAWRIAFGNQSGAWITWEWQYQLRSSLHPAIFAGLYVISEKVMESLALLPQSRATILTVLPKILQGIFAAVGDFFTWKLAECIYGSGSSFSWTALFLTLLSPWQWFCSTRTLSNSLEVVLTSIALYMWPWGLPEFSVYDVVKSSKHQPCSLILGSNSDLLRIRLCLVFAGMACILRPTNVLIWIALVVMIFLRMSIRIYLKSGQIIMYSNIMTLCREVVLCGTAVLAMSAISDRLYFGTWTFPPYQWLNFNITQSLAVFYGTNDWHYYLSQGLPLMLTTYILFALQAILSLAIKRPTRVELSGGHPQSDNLYPEGFQYTVEADLVTVVVSTITTLSLISHKEVRFIYPLLPCLHVLAAPYFLSFFAIISPKANEQMDISRKRNMRDRLSVRYSRIPLLLILVTLNIVIGLYATQVHQRGVIDVLNYLRHDYETLYVSETGNPKEKMQLSHPLDLSQRGNESNEIFAGFLMPCHSTPWRSHLVYSDLQAWALTCEPPLNIPANSKERASYRDEADRFYDDPHLFLKTEMNTTNRQWPRCIVGFEGIESLLQEFCAAQKPPWILREKWRGFNSHWHDDDRRKGMVVVWDIIKQ